MPHPTDDSRVYLIEERTYGTLVSHGAFISRIVYNKDGILFDVWVENSEFMILEELGSPDYWEWE